MSEIPQFDVAKAALEHLELLNCSNQNPLEIAAQFRTLLRSKKRNKNVDSSNNDYTYMDYITADATNRRRGRSCSLADYRGRIRYEFVEDQSSSELHPSHGLSQHRNTDSSIEDISPDSAVGSDSSDLTTFHVTSKRVRYPFINWKQLREKQFEYKLDRVKQFISTKFKTTRLSRIETMDLTLSSLTNVSDKTELCTSDLRKNYEDIISTNNSFRSRSSSNSIRTPSISPSNSPRPTYTISRYNSTSMNHNNEDILFPIADCNLIIQHKSTEQIKRISHFEDLCNGNELFRRSSEKIVYV